MKRKSFFSFLFPRLISGLLVAAVLFGISRTVIDRAYSMALVSGWSKRQQTYEQIVRNYAENKVDATFIDIYTTLFSSDYFRIAEVKEDGSFETITETDYKSIPVEKGIHEWYFITNDKDLLAKGKRTVTLNGRDWTIEYKKCDEAWDICKVTDTKLINSWDVSAMSDVYFSNDLFTISLDLCGMYHFTRPVANSYYIDGDTLHLGKVVQSYVAADSDSQLFSFAKKWDFTDPSKADRYIYADDEGIVKDLMFFPQRVRPDEYFNATNGIFCAGSMNELQKACESRGEDYRNMSFEAVFKEFSEKKTGGEYSYRPYSEKFPYVDGSIDIYEINGKYYMVEYVMETVPFKTYFKPYLIFSAVFLALVAVVIALLATIKPYSQYKKAYENNIFKNNLIDSLAHNMKTPLQILGGYAENLKDVTSDTEKDRYADQILAKTNEMNKDIEAILKTAEKSDRKFTKESVRACIDEVAAKLGAEVFAKGDMKLKMDKEYFKTALYCLLDNAVKYKAADSKIEVDITSKAVTIKNKTAADKFTQGTGIAIAGRILEQHQLHISTNLKDGVFEAKFGKKLGKK